MVRQGQILDALHKRETNSNLAYSTKSRSEDKNIDVATRNQKGRGKGAAGFKQNPRMFRKLAIAKIVAHLPPPVESRGIGLGGIRCGNRFLLNAIIAMATTASTLRKFVKLISKFLASPDSHEVTLAPLNGNKTRKYPTKSKVRRIENESPVGADESVDRPIDCGSVSVPTLTRGQYAFHLALDKQTIKELLGATHLVICSDISTTGIIHALNIVAVALTVKKTGKDAMNSDTYDTYIRKHALNGQTASDKMRKERINVGDSQVAACVGSKIVLSAIRSGIGSALVEHPSLSYMSDGAGENTGDGKGAKHDFCGNGSVLREIFMTRVAFVDILKTFGPHLRRVNEYFGVDFDRLVAISSPRPHPVRLPTDQAIYDHVLGTRLSMPDNPLRFTVLIEGGAPGAHHCLKHIMSLANGDVMIANKELTVMAIAVIRFFRNRHVWSRMNSIILQIFVSDCSKALECAGGVSESSMSWQAGQEDIWPRTRVLEDMMQKGTVLMPCHGSYIRWLSIIRGLALLACMLHVLLAATVIASGQGLEKNKVAMAKDILSGRGLVDKKLVRFEPLVGEKVFKASLPYFALYAGINRFFHVLVWSLIDDVSSRNKDCCLLYMGGTTGVIRTLLWILERKMYVHWKCPNHEEDGQTSKMNCWSGVPVDNGIQNPNAIQQGWNTTLKLAHRGLPKTNPGRGILMFKRIEKGGRGLKQVIEMYGPWGNMVDAPSIQEMFHLLPKIIHNVSRMQGGDTNVIPPGRYRDCYQKISLQDSPEQRERAAWWYFYEMVKKTIYAIERRYTPILFSPLAFLAAAGDVDQLELMLRPPHTDLRKRTFYVATSSGRANAAVFYLQSKELIREYATYHGKDLSLYVQRPYSTALKPQVLEKMKEYIKGKVMDIDVKYQQFFDSKGKPAVLNHPLNYFSELSGLSDEANARIACNQGVESNFSLTAQFTAAGAKRPSERYYHAGQSRNQNVNGRDKELLEDEAFFESFKAARIFMADSEVEEGEKAIFLGNVEDSEKRKQAAMIEKLPVRVRMGQPFQSSNIEIISRIRGKNSKSQNHGAQKLNAASRSRGQGRGGGMAQRAHVAQSAAAAAPQTQKRGRGAPQTRSRGRGHSRGRTLRARASRSAAAGVAQGTGDEAPDTSVASNRACDPPIGDGEASEAPFCAEIDGEPDAAGEPEEVVCAMVHADGESGAEVGGVAKIQANHAGGAASSLTQDPAGCVVQEKTGIFPRVDDGLAGISSRIHDGESEPTDADIMEIYDHFDAFYDSGHHDQNLIQKPDFVHDSNAQESDRFKDAEVPDLNSTEGFERTQEAEVPDTTSTEGLERIQTNTRPEQYEEITWENHPFYISADLTWAEVKKAGKPAHCDYSRLLLQTYKWKPSVVSNVRYAGHESSRSAGRERSVSFLTLTRLDKFQFLVVSNSGNRFYVLWEISGLELIFITRLFKKGDHMMAEYFRVQSTETALEEAFSAEDLQLSQRLAGGRTGYHTYLGKESLLALKNRESSGDRRWIGRTFHTGSVLIETNVENIVSFVGWVPEKSKNDSITEILKELKVSRITDIDWVFSGDSFNEKPFQNEEVISSESDDPSGVVGA